MYTNDPRALAIKHSVDLFYTYFALILRNYAESPSTHPADAIDVLLRTGCAFGFARYFVLRRIFAINACILIPNGAVAYSSSSDTTQWCDHRIALNSSSAADADDSSLLSFASIPQENKLYYMLPLLISVTSQLNGDRYAVDLADIVVDLHLSVEALRKVAIESNATCYIHRVLCHVARRAPKYMNEEQYTTLAVTALRNPLALDAMAAVKLMIGAYGCCENVSNDDKIMLLTEALSSCSLDLHIVVAIYELLQPSMPTNTMPLRELFIFYWTHGMRDRALMLHRMFSFKWDLHDRKQYQRLMKTVTKDDDVNNALLLINVLCSGYRGSVHAELLFMCIDHALREEKVAMADAFNQLLGSTGRKEITDCILTTEYCMLARAGQLAGLEWMKANFGIPRRGERARMIKCLSYVCMRGELGVAKWLVRNYDIDRLDCVCVKDSLPYRRAKSARQQRIMTWLLREFGGADVIQDKIQLLRQQRQISNGASASVDPDIVPLVWVLDQK